MATGDTSKMKIAFSNSYAGNSFRQVMIKNFESMGAEAVKEGKIAGVATVSSNNSSDRAGLTDPEPHPAGL